MPEDTTTIPMIRYLRATADNPPRIYRTPWPNPIPGEPKVVTQPTISGTVAPGQTVYAISGTYSGSPTPTLRRRVYTLFDAAGGIFKEAILRDEGFKIPINAPSGKLLLQEVVFGVAELKAVGAVEVTISALPGLPAFTRAPMISGDATVGNVLTAAHGTATGSPAPLIAGEWYRGETPTGITALTYTTGLADQGSAMGYRDSATNSVGTAYAFSNRITVAESPQNAPVFTVAPTIAYDPVSTRFTCDGGTVAGTPTPALTYLWHYADTETSTLNPRDQGATSTPNEWVPSASLFPDKYFACQVTATNSAGTAVAMSDRQARTEAEGFTVTPTLSGNSPVGNTLTLDPGAWTGSPTEVEYRWYRISSTDVATRLSTLGLTRKTGTDDQGNTIKCRVRIKYASGAEFFSPSATGYTNGIAVTAAEAGLVVSTPAELVTAINNASAGDLILLAPGNYDTSGSVTDTNFAVKISGKTWPNASRLTIRAQDQSRKPVFTGNGFSFQGVNGFNLKWVRFVHNARDSEYKEGGVAVPHNKSNNMEMSGCSNFTIEHCEFSWGHHALQLSGCDDGVVKYCTVTNCGMDHINNTGATNGVYMHHNLMHETRIYTGPWTGGSDGTNHPENRSAAEGYHPDFTQLWTLENTGGRIENFTYKRNWLETQQQTNQHGVYSGNRKLRKALGTLEEWGSRNLLIEGNRIESNHVQGVCFEAVYSNMRNGPVGTACPR